MEAVRFESVSKRFVIHHERARTFQERALNLFRRRKNGTREAFWALRDVSFALRQGRTLGVVGRNGAGKSTLLKLLAGTMRPTSGQVVAPGRVFGLLELAAGFHPDLSGRENVFLNGTFLGLSRQEMRRRLDEIVAFAELEQFIDTPVKHYSSGMYMRLGFAIAISVDPDVLVIDEVLAVGDAAFRQKCFRALADIKARRRTILFVSHDPGAVRRFCDEALWLDQGQVRGFGPVDAVLHEYLATTQPARGTALTVAGKPVDPLSVPAGPVSLLSVQTVDAHGCARDRFGHGDRVGVRVRFRAERSVRDLELGVGLHRADGLYLFGTSTAATGHLAEVAAGESVATCWLGAVPLAAAAYTVSAAAWLDGAPAHRLSQATSFTVSPPRPDQGGILMLQPQWETAGTLSLAHSGPSGPDRRLPSSTRARHDALSEASDGDADGHHDGFPEDAARKWLPATGFRARWRVPPTRVAMGEGDDEFLGPGWYGPEDWPPRVRWTAQRASIYLTQDAWTSTLGITMGRPQHGQKPAAGRVFLQRRLIGHFELSVPGLEPMTFAVQPADRTQEVEITIEVDEPLAPADPDADGDRRVLGVAVREVWLE
ncbi:MAG: ABC transporter ATP-binding protein [Chloroflexi bacterium]|nr:ABC transporter ATP-binding protein [Chloroflexota bacterium]